MTTEAAVGDDGEVEEQQCVNHPGVLSAVACGKCGAFICPRCMIFTPVGVRCRPCAQLRKAPQFDVKIDKLIIAGAGALGASVVAWLIALQLPFFIWLAAIFVGLAAGEVASRLTQRRNNRTLEIVVGGAIIVGFLVIRAFQSVEPGFGYQPAQTGLAAVGVALNNPYALILLALAVIAGVTRLRQ